MHSPEIHKLAEQLTLVFSKNMQIPFVKIIRENRIKAPIKENNCFSEEVLQIIADAFEQVRKKERELISKEISDKL